MRLYEEFKEILKIQKLRRCVSFAGFYSFTTLIIYAYVNNTYVHCKKTSFEFWFCLLVLVLISDFGVSELGQAILELINTMHHTRLVPSF